MADEDKFLRVIVQYVNDQGSLASAATGAKGLQAGLKGVEQQAASTRAQLQQLRAVARELNQVATLTIAAGTALAGPFVAAAAKYVQATGQSEAVSRKWLAATKDIENSVTRIGRVGATDILPWLQKAAKISDEIAAFIERNPGMVDAALKIGATAIALGVVEKAVAEGIRMYADVKLIAAAALQDTAADKMLLAAQMQAGAPVTAGGSAAAGSSGTSFLTGAAAFLAATMGAAAPGMGKGGLLDQVQANFYASTGHPNPTITGDSVGSQIVAWLQTIAGKVGAQPAGPVYGPPAYLAQSNAFFNAVQSADSSKRQTEGLANTYFPNGASSFTQAATQQALPAFQQYQKAYANNFNDYTSNDSAIRMSYLKQMQADEKDFDGSRKLELRDFNQQSAQLEKTYDQNRLLQLRDFNQNEARAQTTYDEQQAKAARNHAEDLAQLAQDFADQQKLSAADHQQRERDLAAAGDALGFEKEKQNFAKQQATDKANYDKEVSRRNADFAQAQADAKQAFEEARAQRLADFKQQQDDARRAFEDAQGERAAQFRQQQADEQAAFDDREFQLKQNFKQELIDNGKHYQDVQTALAGAFTDQLNAIDPILTGMTTLVQKKYQDASAEFQSFLDALHSQAGGGAGYCATGYHWDEGRKMCVADKPGRETHAAGGYAWAGAAAGAGEYVLNRATTDAAERLVGGRLTQDGLMRGLLVGRGMSVDMPISVSGTFGRALIDQVMGAVDGRLTEAFNQFGDAVEAH